MKSYAGMNIPIRGASMNSIALCTLWMETRLPSRVVGDITNSLPPFPLTRYAHSHILKIMRSERLCITLPPRLCRQVKKEADRRQISVSKCIADYIEKNTDDDLVYSREELDRRIKEAKDGLKNGTLPSFASADEMIAALNR